MFFTCKEHYIRLEISILKEKKQQTKEQKPLLTKCSKSCLHRDMHYNSAPEERNCTQTHTRFKTKKKTIIAVFNVCIFCVHFNHICNLQSYLPDGIIINLLNPSFEQMVL